MDEDEIKKALRDLGKETVEYPPDLKFSTKTDFKLQAQGYRNKKKGCPLAVLTIVGTVSALGYGVYFLYTNAIVKVLEVFVWAAGQSY